MKAAAKLLLCVLIALIPSQAFMYASAESSSAYDSFTHRFTSIKNSTPVTMRSVYSAEKVIDVRSLGLAEGIESIADIDCDSSGNLYILTSDGRLFAADRKYELIKEYPVVSAEGKETVIAGAQGILALSPDNIFIADTENQRVIEINGQGKIVKELLCPDSLLIPDDFEFSPVKIEKDSKGTLYVLCDGSYYGALLFNSNNEFKGFYGANTVRGSALTALSYLWDKLTRNDTKRAYSVKKLPFQFSDLYIDGEDFVYTCTGQTGSSAASGQIKKLSPSGTNILYRLNIDGTKTNAESFNFGETVTEKKNNKTVVQNFVSIQADERGYIYALDATYGIVYVYDTDCNLITAFGGGKGEGERLGVFSAASAMTYSSDRVFVADSLHNTVTVFELTDYGRTLLSAQQKTIAADYTAAEEEWTAVLEADSSNYLAMRGLAKAMYARGDYEEAMDMAEKAYDYVTYSQALDRIQSKFISENFLWIFLLIIVFATGITSFAVISGKRRFVLVKNEKLRVFFNAQIHPFDSFNSVKTKSNGSLVIAAVMTLLFYVTSVVSETFSNFRFTSFDPGTSNSLLQLVKSIGLVILFSLANWAVCVLIEGKGRLKDVFIVTSYATLPCVVYNLISTVLSHVIASPSSVIFSGLSTVAVILTGIVLTVGLIIVHEFSFPKFLGSMLLTVFAMLLIVFILFMIGMLLSQLWAFIVTVFMEAVYR